MQLLAILHMDQTHTISMFMTELIGRFIKIYNMSRLTTCTSITRPSSPSNGDILFETDTNRVIVYESAASVWRLYNSDGVAYNTAGIGELHYSSGIFSNASATYYLNVDPVMHFDGKYIDGTDSTNNPANGDAVSTWADRSGNAANYDLTQATGSVQATFDTLTESQNSLAFTSGDFYTLGTTYSGESSADYTAVYIAKIPSATNKDIFYAPLSNGNNASTIWFNARAYGDVVHNSTGRGFHSGSNDNGTEMPTVFNPLHLFIVQRSSATVTGYTGGNNQQWSHSSITNAASISEFGRATSYYTQGNIFEVMFFDSALSTANLNVITNYASNKYGISTTSF